MQNSSDSSADKKTKENMSEKAKKAETKAKELIIMEENKRNLKNRTGKIYKSKHVINYLETRCSFHRF